jgi:hypothetical protein
MVGYNFVHSYIGSDGREYMMFLTQPEQLNEHGLLNGHAINIDVDHRKQKSEVYEFCWISGAPHKWNLIQTLKDEVVTEDELDSLVKRLGIEIK